MTIDELYELTEYYKSLGYGNDQVHVGMFTLWFQTNEENEQPYGHINPNEIPTDKNQWH